MKPRRLMFIVELESNETISELKSEIRRMLNYRGTGVHTKVIQVQYNAIKKEKKSRRR